MSDLTPLTLLVQFVPTIIVTFAYLLFFRHRRNRFIEAFVLLMVIKVVSFFLYYIWMYPEAVPPGFNNQIGGGDLYWILLTDFLFQFSYSLQEFFTWVMVSFVAVLFGQLVLLVKLALQEPLRMRFHNVIHRMTGKKPESDGYSGLRDRMNHVTFSGVESQPLDPRVVSKAWGSAWKDYLIIGLATLLPSIDVYMAQGDTYIIGVLIFLTWIYRFGYPASNRIAKGAGIKLGDKDLGAEMMRGVLGWFFRFNILLTMVTIALNAWERIQSGTLAQLGLYYISGLILAAPPILFALLLLPMTESFSEVLYKRVFEGIARPSAKLATINWRRALVNFVSSLTTSALATAAFVGAIMGITLSYAYRTMGVRWFYPDQVAPNVLGWMGTWAMNNAALIGPTTWTLLMLAIPLGMMVFVGVLGHYVSSRVKGGVEAFALVAGFTVSTAAWFIMPGWDFIINPVPASAVVEGLLFYRLLPTFIIPGSETYIYRLASQFVVFVPMFISAVLFILYYYDFKERWKKETGEQMGPLLSVHSRDIRDAVGLFVLGVVGSIVGVFALSLLMDPYALGNLIWSLIVEIGEPNGLEKVFEINVLGMGSFLIVTEHNIIRTLLMLIIGPVFWTLILWFAAVKRKSIGAKHASRIGVVILVAATACSVIIASWGFGYPWLAWLLKDVPNWSLLMAPSQVFAAELGVVVALLFGAIIAVTVLLLIIDWAATKGSNGLWFIPLLLLVGLEYFVYDDQFTLISLIVVPMILAIVYKTIYSGKPEVKSQDLLITYIRFSLMSVAITEVLSTALWVAGLASVTAITGGSVPGYLAKILPHGIIEIPAFLFAAAASLRIARDLAPSIVAEDWASVPSKTRILLSDPRTWRTYILVLFFLVVAALIEANITPIISTMVP